MPRSKKNNNRMGNLRRRFEKLKKTNNNSYNIIYSLEDIGLKSNELLLRHDFFNKQRLLKNKNINIDKYITTLINDYEKLIESCEIYHDNISINNLKKALTKNLRELLKFLPYYNSNSNKDVSIVDLEIRFKKLSKYADKIRGKNKQTFKKFLKRFRYK